VLIVNSDQKVVNKVFNRLRVLNNCLMFRLFGTVLKVFKNKKGAKSFRVRSFLRFGFHLFDAWRYDLFLPNEIRSAS